MVMLEVNLLNDAGQALRGSVSTVDADGVGDAPRVERDFEGWLGFMQAITELTGMAPSPPSPAPGPRPAGEADRSPVTRRLSRTLRLGLAFGLVSVAAACSSGDDDVAVDDTVDETAVTEPADTSDASDTESDGASVDLPDLVPVTESACDLVAADAVAEVVGAAVTETDDGGSTCEFSLDGLDQRIFVTVGQTADAALSVRDVVEGAIGEADAVTVDVGSLGVFVPTFQTTYFHRDGRYATVGVNGAPVDSAQTWTVAVASVLDAALG